MNIGAENHKFFAKHDNDFFLFPDRFVGNSEHKGGNLGASLEGITRRIGPSLLNYYHSVHTEDGIPIHLGDTQSSLVGVTD